MPSATAASTVPTGAEETKETRGARGARGAKAGFRPDIEGLRAVAILTVLAYHAGLPVRGGFVGVDIFFVISGFLITGLLVAELDRSGSISWIRFVGRRIRRLLPAAVLVLVSISAVSYFRRAFGIIINAAQTGCGAQTV